MLKMGQSDMMPGYDCHLTGRKFHESPCERDLLMNIIPNHQARKVIKMVNYIVYWSGLNCS